MILRTSPFHWRSTNERRTHFKDPLMQHRLESNNEWYFQLRVVVLWKTIKAKMTEAGKMLTWNEWMHIRGKHSLGDKINNPVNVRWWKIGTKIPKFQVGNYVEKTFQTDFNWKYFRAQHTVVHWWFPVPVSGLGHCYITISAQPFIPRGGTVRV